MNFRIYIVLFLFFIFVWGCIKSSQLLPQEPDIPSGVNPTTSDTLQFFFKLIEKQDGDCQTELNNCVKISVRYPEILNPTRSPVENEINTYIKNQVFSPLLDSSQYKNLEQYADGIIADYNEFIAENPQYVIDWKIEKNVEILYNSKNIFSVGFFNNIFTGGAHGSTTVNYVNYNVTTGKRIKLSDIFVDEYEETLLNLAEKEFRKIKNLMPEDSFEDQGYWFNKNNFELTDNFAIRDTGLTFYYNNYEIAPYAFGPSELTLTYQTLAEILKKGGLLSQKE